MYRTILLAYDGTLEGRLALREGALLAKTCGASVVLMAVVESPAFDPVAAEAGIAYVPRDPSADTEKVLAEGAARLTRMRLAHRTLLRTGDPAACIVEVAREIGADLVVVGHHRQGRLARWLVGSVTASLVERLECSLLTARHEISDADLYGE